jgi:serine/threonine protein kinase
VRYCTSCHSVYPNDFRICPKDHTDLVAASELQAGMVLRGKYEILGKLGAGGMATVYRARHLAFGEIRAIKLVGRRLEDDEEFLRRFRNEAIVARRLQHPNAVRVEDLDTTEDGRPFIVMEYVEGRNLREVIRRDGALGLRRAVAVARQVAAALSAAHELGIVHRDIKPDNILITGSGPAETAKVLDFGIAKAKEDFGGDHVATRTGTMVGTPQYISPEQAMGRRGDELDGRADLYSLGVVLYEALAARKPFDGDTPVAVAHNVRHAEAPPLASLRGDLDPGLVAVVERAMAREPSARFATAREMAEALGVHGTASAVVGRVDGDATSILSLRRDVDGDGTTALPVAPSPPPIAAAGRSSRRIPWWVPPAVAAVGIVLLALVLASAGRDATDGVEPARAEVASDLRELAERVRVGDGPRGPEVGDRLEQVASEVEAGGGTQAADSLLVDVAAWHQQRQLYDTAAAEATAVLLRVPGAQQPTTTVAPTTTQPPPADEDDDDRRGKGKKGRGDD